MFEKSAIIIAFTIIICGTLTSCKGVTKTPFASINQSSESRFPDINNANANNAKANNPQANQLICQLISNDDFYSAVREYDLKRPVDERNGLDNIELKDEIQITRQLIIEDENKYIIASGCVQQFNFVSIFKISNVSKKLIAVLPYGEQPYSMRILDNGLKGLLDYGTNKHSELLEITSYGASGSNSTQVVSLYHINDEKVSEVWNYPVFWKDSHQGKGKGIYDYLSTYGTYMYVSNFQRSYTDSDDANFAIIVNETNEVNHTRISEPENIIGTERTTIEKVFIWDRMQEKFIEKQLNEQSRN